MFPRAPALDAREAHPVVFKMPVAPVGTTVDGSAFRAAERGVRVTDRVEGGSVAGQQRGLDGIRCCGTGHRPAIGAEESVYRKAGALVAARTFCDLFELRQDPVP